MQKSLLCCSVKLLIASRRNRFSANHAQCGRRHIASLPRPSNLGETRCLRVLWRQRHPKPQHLMSSPKTPVSPVARVPVWFWRTCRYESVTLSCGKLSRLTCCWHGATHGNARPGQPATWAMYDSAAKSHTCGSAIHGCVDCAGPDLKH